MIVASLLIALQQDEARYYTVDQLTPPEGEVLEVGGLDFLSDGRLVVGTRRGEVWLVTNPLADDPNEARFERFADGLWEGLGVNVVDDEIYVVQRGELSRLSDLDGDGRCDRIDTLCDDWGLSGNYHEFAYGLPRDAAGNFYVSLNVSFLNPEWWHGKSPVPWRGWILRIQPDGTSTPIASGLRSPCGLGFDADGELFATDNQGDWMPASPIFHIEEGGFYGHPASLAWTPAYRESATEPSDRIPPERAATDRKNAAVWLPYERSRSPGNLVPDLTGGSFGPFGRQMFLAELTNGRLFRVQTERVRGQLQGAVFPFRADVGSACRVVFAPDGSLIVGRTNRGWGGRAPATGIARVRWTGVEPFEIERVSLVPGGFALSLTAALAPDATPSAAVRQYDYDYWWEYGSPERASVELAATIEMGADRRSLVVRVAKLAPAKVARVKLAGLVAADGRALLHPEFAYTVNQLVDGELTTEHVAKIVPPPAARESDEEGWLRLSWGDATDGWNSSGWELCDVALDPDDATRFVTQKGVSALVNSLGDEPSDYASKFELGSGTYHAGFFLPEDGVSGLLLQGRYRVALSDDRSSEPSLATSAAIDGGAAWEGAAPTANPYLAAGEWNEIDIEFVAPTFDADGTKRDNARILWIRLNDVTVQEELELPGSSNGLAEVALGPFVLEGARGPVAIGNLQFKPARELLERDGWTSLFDVEADDPLEGWTATGGGIWEFEEGVLIGEGPAGVLVSRRAYGDHEVRCSIKISEGGNSGLFVRASADGAQGTGYEAEVNSSYADGQKTGSLRDLSIVKSHLVPADTWFEYRVRVVDEAEGSRISIYVNGVLVNDFVDTERRFRHGHIALQQHHEGSVVEVRDLAVRAVVGQATK